MVCKVFFHIHPLKCHTVTRTACEERMPTWSGQQSISQIRRARTSNLFICACHLICEIPTPRSFHLELRLSPNRSVRRNWRPAEPYQSAAGPASSRIRSVNRGLAPDSRLELSIIRPGARRSLSASDPAQFGDGMAGGPGGAWEINSAAGGSPSTSLA